MQTKAVEGGLRLFPKILPLSVSSIAAHNKKPPTDASRKKTQNY